MSIFLLVFVIWLTGTSLLLLLPDRTVPLRDLPAEFPSSIAVGVIALHALFLMSSWRGEVPWWHYALFTTGLALAACLRLRQNSVETLGFSLRERRRLLAGGGLLLLFALQYALVFPSLSLPLLDWDARILWALKAKHLTEQPTIGTDFFRDPYQLHIHPRYPLLVPWLGALASAGLGYFSEARFRLILFAFSFLTTWQLYMRLVQRRGLKFAWLVSVVLILTGAWVSAQIKTQVELVLAFFVLMASCRLGDWLERGKRDDFLVAAIFLTGAVMTKNEGMLAVISSAMALAAVLARWGAISRAAMAALALVLLVVVLSAPWLAQRAAIPPVSDENYLSRISLSVLAAAPPKLPVIVSKVGKLMANWRAWHLFWPLISMTAAYAIACRKERSASPCRLVAFVWWGYLFGILFVYIISPWREIALHIGVSFNRTTLPLLPLGLLLIGTIPSARNRAQV